MTLSPRTEEYLGRDLHAEGAWPKESGDTRARYGAVVFDARGRVLLREPRHHYGGFVWTFPKGGPEGDEHPAATALRETWEETGLSPEIVGHLSGVFRGSAVASSNYFYVMYVDRDDLPDEAVSDKPETASLRWVHPDAAPALLSRTTEPEGRARDLRTLEAAVGEFGRLVAAR